MDSIRNGAWHLPRREGRRLPVPHPGLDQLVAPPALLVAFHGLRSNAAHAKMAFGSLIDRCPEQCPALKCHQFKPRPARPERTANVHQRK